ncbi:MAG: hypothetical protein HY436_00550, partial [Candidatus Liptonbacteria bacterium]|nr:hypothetical protein [Candidatus Liptonbacteria bacterium]
MPLPISTTQLRKKLTETNVVSPEQFDKLAREAEHKNQNLFDVLVSQRVIDAYSLNNLIASALGIELADLASRGIDASVVTLLPEEIARQRQVVLFKRESDGSLDAAMADPGDLETIQFLSQHLKTKVNPFLAAAEDLNRGFAIYGSQAAADVKREIEEQIQASLRTQKMTIE